MIARKKSETTPYIRIENNKIEQPISIYFVITEI